MKDTMLLYPKHLVDVNDDLEFVLEYKIKPLLEEYFYGDIKGLDNALEIIRKS